jgi:serine/threonine protein kinase
MPDSRPLCAAADRNLLFGILALQLDFISREQLVTAMNTWVLDKHKALGDILREQGTLSPERHALLEALVQEHLRQHGDDPEQSLAAVSPLQEMRHELEQIADPDVQASLAHVSDARPQEADSYATRSFTVGTPTSSGLRFRILRPHAKGGLGQVSVALDEELHREVALKEIQERHADDANSRTRFLLEAEITGGLEHPGIVPVYGLGCYADGRPFYAMRFIRGDSLKDAIQRFHASDPSGGRKPPESGSGGLRPPLGERTLAFRKLLGRFVDVCQAIQYAHDRGVLHRDLKPGNVMLGKYGETLVVDWGLAKVQGRPEGQSASAEGTLRPSSASGSAATQMGSALGTPAYMSPEQAAGRLDQLGPASDVYSLGATLYCLLTGQAPIQEPDTGRVLERVQKGDFPRPRQIKPEVNAALEAVCLKAMALRPQDRYASPRVLADDLEHWLAGEPISAWPEPWTVKTARWVSRHRTLVSGAAAALLVGLVSLLIATGLLSAANEQLAAARDRADVARQRAEHSEQQALANEKKAQGAASAEKAAKEAEAAQRRQAVANEQKALAAAKAEKTAKEAEAAQRKQAVANEKKALAAAAAERTAKDAATAQRKQAETVADLLASVFRKLDPQAEEKGLSLKEQLVSQLDALAARLDKEFADQPLVQARLRDALGQAQLGLGQTGKALVLWQQALAARRKYLPVDDPDTLSSMNNLALAYRNAGQLGRALPLLKEALARMKAQLGPDDPLTLIGMNNLAMAYREAKQVAKALPLLEEALARFKAKLGPDDPHTLSCMNNLALAYKSAGQLDKALPLLEETLTKRKAKLGPNHVQTLNSMNNLATAYQATGQLDKALPLFEETLARTKARLGPDHPDTLQSINNLAAAYREAGKLEQAQALLRELAQRRKQGPGPLASGGPDELAARGVAWLHQGEYAQAEPVLRKALELRSQKQPEHWLTFSAQSDLGACLVGLKRYAEAEPLLLDGYEGMRKRRADIPAASRPRLVEAAERVIHYYEVTKQPERAARWRKELEATRRRPKE